jgi:DNA transposition AAA+ family ATPase
MITAPNHIDGIKPELCAAKLAAIRNFEYPELQEAFQKAPRMREALWFIQWASWQPGGLAQLTVDLVACCPHRLGSKTMRACGSKPVYTRPELAAIIRELSYPISSIDDWFEDLSDGAPSDSVKPASFLDEDEAGFQKEPAKVKRAVDAFLKEHSPSKLMEWVRARALNEIPGLLARFCNEPGASIYSPRYFDGLLDAVYETMAAHAQERSKRLAMTAVACSVFDGLEFAYANSALVSITGDSRFGKTESIKTWCEMYPGRARLASVPCSNSDRDLWRAILESYGEACVYTTTATQLRERVEHIVSQGHLMIVLDEAHFLIPQRYSETTPPMRLNWIRTQISDRKCPCVLVHTPQAYRRAADKFVRKTGFTFEQFVGRVSRTINLPGDLGFEDLSAVVRIHFPDLEPAQVKYIVGTAMASETYVKTIENVAMLASWLARRDGRDRVDLNDVDQALSEIVPQEVPQARPGPSKQTPEAKALPVPTSKNFKPQSVRHSTPGKAIAFALQSDLNAPETHAGTEDDGPGKCGRETPRFAPAMGCPGSPETAEVLA